MNAFILNHFENQIHCKLHISCYYITVVLIFVFYLLLVFTFYIFTSQGDRTYRRVRYNDPAVDNLLEIVSNEL